MNAIQQLSGALFNRLMPKESERKISSRVIFLPMVLLLITLGMGFLKPSPATPYFAVIGIVGFLGSIFLRTTGVACSYGALAFCLLLFYKEIPQGERLWQVGLCFSWAVDYLIVVLGMEEIETIQAEQQKIFQHHLDKVQNEIEQLKKERKDERESLEAELNQWKAEAEQRRIEKRQDDRLITLVQSEIELLTGQKEQFITTAFEARKIQVQLKQQLEALQEECKKLEDEKILLQQQLNERAVLNPDEIQALQNTLEQNKIHYQQQLEEHENRYNELLQAKDQIEEDKKIKILLMRQEIESLQKILLEIENDYQNKLKQQQDQHAQLLSANAEISEQSAQKMAEIEALKAKLSQVEELYQAQCKDMQMQLQLLIEERECLQEQLAEKTAVSTDDIAILKQNMAQAQGLNKQLRNQFEEKSKVLSQTRRELFQIQGRLMTFEREVLEREIAPHSSEDTLMNLIVKLDEEKSVIEEEICKLEELVQSLLST